MRLGLLFDFPQGDGGDSFEAALQLGLDQVAALDVGVEILRHEARGLPLGTEQEVIDGFAALDEAGCDLIVGPSISDNCVVARDLADAAELPSINYSGGERTRSSWMFHYQVGSLEEEPPVLVRRLVARGFRSAAVIHDASIVGERYRECLGWAATGPGLELTGTVPISPLAESDTLASVATSLRATEPDALVYLGLGAASHAVAVALADARWTVPVVANSALMFGYARPDWRDGWAGWEYLDGVADDNRVRAELRERDRRTAAGPVGCAAYDIGRLVGEAIARADRLDRAGLREGLERVKQLPAASGRDGTLMGFGVWDRAALKGEIGRASCRERVYVLV